MFQHVSWRLLYFVTPGFPSGEMTWSPLKSILVGGFSPYPSDKWWSSSMGRMTTHIWNGKMKAMFQTTNQYYIYMVYIYIYTYDPCMYIHITCNICLCLRICMCMCLYVSMYMYAYVYMYTTIYIYIYVCVMLYMQCANTQTLTTLSTATAPYTISPISSWTLPSWKTWYPGKTWSPGRISVERAIIRIGIYKLYPNLWGFWSNHPQQPEAISSIALQHPLAIQEPPSTTGLNHHWNRRESFFPS